MFYYYHTKKTWVRKDRAMCHGVDTVEGKDGERLKPPFMQALIRDHLRERLHLQGDNQGKRGRDTNKLTQANKLTRNSSLLADRCKHATPAENFSI